MSEAAPVADRDGGKYRRFGPVHRRVMESLFAALTLAGCVWALQLHHSLGVVVLRQQYLGLILGLGLVACFIGVKTHPGERYDRVPWFDWLAVALSVLVTGYIAIRFPFIVRNMGLRTAETWFADLSAWIAAVTGFEVTERQVFGVITVVLVIEATRRLAGWSLIWLALAGLVYTAYSDLFPGIFEARPSAWPRVFSYMYVDFNGVFGVALNVFATMLITFILFGQTLYAVGGDRILNDAALAMMGRYRGGPAKVAIVGSSLFGTVSGSVVSNVMTDGPVTIPMMVRTGYRPAMAAAIEAVASNGGQILPPVMGLTAFLMADWLGISYAVVALAALIPAGLYYIAVFAQVDFEAGRLRLTGLPAADLPRGRDVWKRVWVFIPPFVVLVYTLMVANWQPGKAALGAVATMVVLAYFLRETRPSLPALWGALVGTGRILLSLVAIVAIAGVIIGSMQLSGIAFSMSLILVTLAGNSLILLLAYTAGLSIVLGMGLPTSVIYILLASIVAPALVDFGIQDLAAHMFIFYFGSLSSITPPLAFATIAAASIAGCSFWRAGWIGMRLGFVAYIIPFVFVFQPELLLVGTPLQVATGIVTCAVGIVLVAGGLAGHFLARLAIWQRLTLGASGLLLIPSPVGSHALWLANAIGLALGVAVLASIWLGRRQSSIETGAA